MLLRSVPFALALSFAVCTAGCGARTTLSTPEPAPRKPACGDHLVQEGEACDDANTSDTDACVDGCVFAACGDGHVRDGFEPCDDGNAINTDGCRNNCALPTCGDGIVDFGEECDDGNDINTDACPSLCLFARCGDGFLHQGVEACDGGPANADKPGYLLTQGALAKIVEPVARSQDLTSFYSYTSASAHTGFEALQASRLFLYRDLTNGSLSLVTIHGVDLEASGQDQPSSKVEQSFVFLPSETLVSIADDYEEEFSKDSPTTARGAWSFHHNTDGGALSGLPSPGAWSIDVTFGETEGITAWDYIEKEGSPIALEIAETSTLSAFNAPSACRLDCTIPRCGDGILDGGEACDDGNTVGGDGCSSDCKSSP